ncbi:hypothetical protein AS589_14070 [Empedobacter brevis]|nr:hypothetical protein AS589_14070 [Empedobacter brevis]
MRHGLITTGLNHTLHKFTTPIFDNGDDPPKKKYPSNKDVTPYEVGVEWLTGEGPRHRDFTNGDYFTELLRKHDFIKDTKTSIKTGIANGSYGTGFSDDVSYSLGGVQGVGKYVKDYSTLLTGGTTGNLSVTYLGSFSLNWKIVSINKNIATVQFKVENSSTMQSASRPPILGYLPFWQKSVGSKINKTFEKGWGSKTSQSFKWKEYIKLK